MQIIKIKIIVKSSATIDYFVIYRNVNRNKKCLIKELRLIRVRMNIPRFSLNSQVNTESL